MTNAGRFGIRRRLTPSGLMSVSVVSIAALLVAYTVAQGLVVAVLLIAVVALLTGLFPSTVPAVLLAAPGLLHVLTFVTAGPTTRGDVLTSPLKYLAVLGALFGPPVLVTVVRHSRVHTASIRRPQPGWYLLVGMLALASVLALRTPGSPTPTYATTKTLGFAAFSLFPALIVCLTLEGARDVERVFDAVIVLGGAWILLALVTAAVNGDYNLYLNGPAQVFGGTNEAGGGLGMRAGLVLIAALGSAFGARRGSAFVRLPVAAVATIALVLSGHRGSLIATAAGLVILLALRARLSSGAGISPRTIPAVALAAVAVASWFAFSIAPSFIQQRYADPLESTSFEARREVQAKALHAWEGSPLLGTGTGSSAYAIAGVDQPAVGVVRGLYPHNVIVEILTETGMVGLLLYLGTIGVTAAIAVRRWRAGPEGSWAVPVALALVAQAFVASQGTGDLTIHYELWLGAALLAVAVTRCQRPGARGQGEAGRG